MSTIKAKSKKNYKSTNGFKENHEMTHENEKPDTSCKKKFREGLPPINNLEKFASRFFIKNIKKNKMNKMSHTWTLETIPRQFLKKCRLCCFKKRLCFTSPSQCTALDKRCFSCGKQGHFPKSKKFKSKKVGLVRIPQFDGGDDEIQSTNRDSQLSKEVYANCLHTILFCL